MVPVAREGARTWRPYDTGFVAAVKRSRSMKRSRAIRIPLRVAVDAMRCVSELPVEREMSAMTAEPLLLGAQHHPGVGRRIGNTLTKYGFLRVLSGAAVTVPLAKPIFPQCLEATAGGLQRVNPRALGLGCAASTGLGAPAVRSLLLNGYRHCMSLRDRPRTQ